ncbi:hypothetical protein [Streptomyces sp. NPDC048111]|uniref:hypothetical protein n=1 Tax=Streptomyces sp. NPDC048111 TaxID=3365500 RepID=UPI003724C3C2
MVVLLCGCVQEPSAPSIPTSLCWGAFNGDAVAPLVPTGRSFSQTNDIPFDVFEQRSNTYCSLFVDDRDFLLVQVERGIGGKGTDWNVYARRHGSPVQAGDEGLVYDGGAGAVFLCERPDLPTGPTRPLSEKYVELELTADRAADTPRNREALTDLLKRFAQFAKQHLKCRN